MGPGHPGGRAGPRPQGGAAEARALAACPTAAFGEIRRMLARSESVDVHDGLAAELDAIRRTGATADAREGIAAFGERREPRFEGR